MSSDQDKTPEEIREEARRLLAEIKAEKQAAAVLKDAQNRQERDVQPGS